jgi:hypothetical protein
MDWKKIFANFIFDGRFASGILPLKNTKVND